MPWYTTAHTRRDAERQALQRAKTMTDDELLDKAAQAAGMKRRSVHWNSLENNGDAFQLAVKLKLSVQFEARKNCEWQYIIWVDSEKNQKGGVFEPYTGDVNAATRRAITRAAAVMCAK